MPTKTVDLGSVIGPRGPIGEIPTAITTGTGSAYVATVDGIDALENGMMLTIIPHTVSTSMTPTLNVNGLGAKGIRRQQSTTTAGATSGASTSWLTANKPVLLQYDGTYWVVVGKEQPVLSDASGTLPVNKGGTGRTSWTPNRLPYPSASTSFAQLPFPTEDGSVLMQNTDGAPYWTPKEELLKDTERMVQFNQMADAPHGNWNFLTFGNGRFVAMEYSGNRCMYSDDGITWTLTSLPNSNSRIGLVFGGGKFVALSAETAIHSADGINWTQADTITGADGCICFGNGKFVALPSNGTTAAYSVDGITWTQVTLPVSGKYRCIAYGNGKFVAPLYGEGKAIYSTDGIVWTQTNLPTNTFWDKITFGGGRFLILAKSSKAGTTAYSDDGITWTASSIPRPSSNDTTWNAVTYGNGKFTALGDYTGGKTFYSEDGNIWKEGGRITGAAWKASAYGNGMIVAVQFCSTGSSGKPSAYSKNGVDWTETTPTLNSADGAMTQEMLRRAVYGLMGTLANVGNGMYYGTGYYGSESKVSVYIPFKPKLLILTKKETEDAASTWKAVIQYTQSYGATEVGVFGSNNSGTSMEVSFTQDGSKFCVSWYSTAGAAEQMNEGNKTYMYIAFG